MVKIIEDGTIHIYINHPVEISSEIRKVKGVYLVCSGIPISAYSDRSRNINEIAQEIKDLLAT